MRKTLFPLTVAVLFSVMSCAQKEHQAFPSPLLLDKSALSGVGLKKIDIKDEPEKDFYQKNLFRGREISVYVVSTETWTNKISDFPFDEFIYMFHGEAFVKPENNPAQLFHSGSYFFAPKGFTGEWEIRAGENLHYELSVISSQRVKTSNTSENPIHQLFDPAVLSGTHISLDESGQYIQELKKGIELMVHLHAESPNDRPQKKTTAEKLYHLLSGQLTLTDSNGLDHKFYSGDFFILPSGYTGHWKSEGHGIIKYLTVEKTP